MEYSDSFTIKIEQNKEGLNSLKADWLKLLSKIPTPSLEQDWRWNAVLAQQVLGSRLVLLGIYAGTELIALFPFEDKKIKHFGISFRCLSNLSDSRLLDLSDALVHPDWCQKNLLQAIKRYLTSSNFDLIEFSEFTAHSLVAQLPADGWLKELAKYKNAFITCTTIDDLKSLSKKHIKNVERLSAKAAAELGAIEMEIIVGHHIEQTDINDLIEIENSGWKAASGTSIESSNTRSFYEKVIAELSPTDDAYIIFLKAGHKRIACGLAFKAGSRLFLHKIAYRDNVKEFGPGNIMLLNLLRTMANSPDINQVNLVTCPEWCERWHLQIADRFSLRCFNTNLKGRLFALLLKIKKRFAKTSTTNKPVEIDNE